jgi:tetratricopeptide (TPR) repeat protein
VQVPFFPQSRYQCGPAALATVLVASGVKTTPDSLVPEVYLPERRGSFQLELMASARRHGRLPYEMPQDLNALLEEVAAGQPVLVLQNLGLSWLPRWHYAVVIGYDPLARHIVLRSGRQARRLESLDRFSRSWALADRWALRILRPGELPAVADAGVYLRAILNSRQSLPGTAVLHALERGMAHWPGSADLAFAAANQARAAGSADAAEKYYEQALRVDGEHLGALNNLADLLHENGEVERARELIDRALRSSPQDSPLRAVIEATSAEIEDRE